MAEVGGEIVEVSKDGGGGSGAIDVPFEDKEAMVPMFGLELFEGVFAVVPE